MTRPGGVPGRLWDAVETVCRERDRSKAELVRSSPDGSWIVVRTGPATFPTVIEASNEPPSEERARRLGAAVDREFSRLGGRTPVRGDLMTIYEATGETCRVWRVCGVLLAEP